MASFIDRLQNAWSVFTNPETSFPKVEPYTYISGLRPDRVRLTRGNERSIVTSVFNRIALDVSSIDIKHVKLDDNDRYLEEINSYLNDCFKFETNLDQTPRSFLADIVLSMFDEGCVAVVPTDVLLNTKSDSYDILSMRVAKIVEWAPLHVRVSIYNEKLGRKQEIVVPKSKVAIIENPLYAVMNEPNSTLQRLIRKLNLLDSIDEQSGAGKLDLIIQLPYVIKTDLRRQQAEERRKEIEMQLAGSKYGIAYTDGTEHITQLNRPVENNLMKQIEFLTTELYSQLGITTDILNGTANSDTMTNYYSRTVEPIISAIVDEMKRKFLTRTARSRKQSIMFFRDPFKLIPIEKLADIADKFTRNEIMSSNEMRQKIGMKPVNDPRADELRNKNINAGEGEQFANARAEEPVSSVSGGNPTEENIE